MRNTPKETIQSVVERAYEAAGGIQSAAADLGLAQSTLSEHTEIPKGKRAGGLGINYVDTLARINSGSAAVLAEHFAALAGGTFHAIRSDDEPRETWEHVAALVKEAAEGVSALNLLPHGGSRQNARQELVDIVRAAEAAIRDIDLLPDATVIPHRGRI
ncbi:MAG: hypothetical protein ACU0A5_14810 [Salipiger marinus]|jgi:hypothetical protein|uniref:hypothetical protein n=1 Tax=Salipiger marinus TaxID=555512 RepID=UPI0040582450